MYSDEFFIQTNKKEELINITNEVSNLVKKAGAQNRLCNIYVPHATAGLIINENADPEIEKDILKALSLMVSENENWRHDRIDNNATAHIKSSIIGVSISVPIKNGNLGLGTWQDIFLAEFDGPRNRKIIVTML